MEAGQRLSFEDAVTLYRSPDILAVGYLANLVRERMHGNLTYFNVNRHINPTDVCATPKPTPCRSMKCGTAPARAGARR